MTPRPRVGVVGPRRVRQGLGPFVVRELLAAGCDVPAVQTTSAASADAARAELLESAGIEVRAHTDLGSLLDEGLDALAILSPSGTHRAPLEAALEAGLHVFCEKPFVWLGVDPVGTARRLAAGYSERGLALVENCQWPETLPAFRALHPDLGEGPPAHFRMRLTPASRGLAMIGDALPHALSLLQALAPARAARVEDVRPSTRDPHAEELTLDFTYRADGHPVACTVELSRGAEQPREAGYAVDGREARRLVRLSDYALFFTTGARLVNLPDPLGARVRRFTKLLEGAIAGRTELVDQAAAPVDRRGSESCRTALPGGPHGEIVQRMELLDVLAAAFEGGPE